MSEVRYSRRAGVIARQHQEAATCDYCARMFPVEDLAWISEAWRTASGRIGYVIGNLCPECRELAIEPCWRCGRLSGCNPCARCEEHS
jgi:hypothetical protein